MPSSRLSKYFRVLRVLALGPQKVDSIAYVTKMERNSLKPHLDFLVSNNLVEELRGSGERVVYAINKRGLSVFETLMALKHLEKLKKTSPTVE